MTKIANAGEAMRVVQALLRHNGYSTDNVEARAYINLYEVTGTLTDLDDRVGKGTFTATIRSTDDYNIEAGAFGTITPDGIDPFGDL